MKLLFNRRSKVYTINKFLPDSLWHFLGASGINLTVGSSRHCKPSSQLPWKNSLSQQ